MARRGATHATHEAYEVERGAQATTVRISLKNAGHPPHLFAANWCRLYVEGDFIKFSFGQRQGDSLMSQVEIQFGRTAFEQGFVALGVFAEQFLSDEDGLFADGEGLPLNTEKYLLESATVVSLSWAGDDGEMNFYWVSPWDMHLLNSGVREKKKLRGPTPVLSISLSKAMIGRLIRTWGRMVEEASDE